MWSFYVEGCKHILNREEPKNWGALGLSTLGMGGVVDSKKHASLHMEYLAEQYRSVTDGRTDRETPADKYHAYT